MLSKIQAGELGPVAAFLNDDCESDLLRVSRHLSHCLYLLHHLPEDAVSRISLQNTCWFLWRLKEALVECWYRKLATSTSSGLSGRPSGNQELKEPSGLSPQSDGSSDEQGLNYCFVPMS